MKKIAKIAILVLFAAVSVGLISRNAAGQTLKERDEVTRVKYQEAWGQYQKEVNFYKTSRENFLNARNKFQKSKNAADKKDLEEKTKSFLGKTVSSIIKKLEALKNWVSNRRAFNESDRQAIAAEIDKDIVWLNDRAIKISGATPDQIKEEAKTIRQYWKTHRLWMKKIIGQIWASRINFVIVKAEDFAGKLSAKTEELKAAGKNTAKIEAWLLEFNQYIAAVKEKYEVAKAKFSEIKTETSPDFENELKTADELFKAGHNFIKEANQRIKEVYAKLLQIIGEMKKAGKAAEAPVD